METYNGPTHYIDYITSEHKLYTLIKNIDKFDNETHMYEFPNKDLLNIAIDYMKSKGYDNFCEPTIYNSLIENWVYNVNGHKEPELCEHVDDDGGVNGNVNTLIIYYEFDDGIKGGNLYININNDIEIFDPRPTEKGICVLCIRGDILHEIQNMNGRGRRCCLVLQFPCIRT